MGAVYKAEHTSLERFVAIKVLSSQLMRQPDAVARFRREIKAIGKLSDPHIVQAFDAGEVNGTHYLAMEYVEGIDLQKHVREKGALSVGNACKVVKQAAQALAAAHAAGLVHRDVKPSNLLAAKSSPRPSSPHAPREESRTSTTHSIAPQASNATSPARPADPHAEREGYNDATAPLDFFTQMQADAETQALPASSQSRNASRRRNREISEARDGSLTTSATKTKTQRLLLAAAFVASVVLAGIINKITTKDGAVTEIKVPDGAKVQITKDDGDTTTDPASRRALAPGRTDDAEVRGLTPPRLA
jgi:serine/threonine protein kinase